MIDIAHAQIEYPGKGEDTFVVRKEGNSYLLAVADGLSMDNGRAAARWVKEYLDGVSHIRSARSIFEAMKVALLNDLRELEKSETTLTCGILSESESSGVRTLRFEFFAIGDSPIWKVVSTFDGRYPYQRYLIHGEPYPAETSKVYSTLRLKEREVKGVVSFGSIDLSAGDVLVVCSDGIPEREVMVRDLNTTGQSDQPKLCEWLFDSATYEDASLQNILDGYRKRELLFDDATLIVARLAMQPIGGGVEPAQESFPEGDDDEDLSVDETTEGGKNNLPPSTRDEVPAIDTVESVQPKRGEQVFDSSVYESASQKGLCGDQRNRLLFDSTKTIDAALVAQPPSSGISGSIVKYKSADYFLTSRQPISSDERSAIAQPMKVTHEYDQITPTETRGEHELIPSALDEGSSCEVESSKEASESPSVSNAAHGRERQSTTAQKKTGKHKQSRVRKFSK